jgi:hypothetical protein
MCNLVHLKEIIDGRSEHSGQYHDIHSEVILAFPSTVKRLNTFLIVVSKPMKCCFHTYHHIIRERKFKNSKN